MRFSAVIFDFDGTLCDTGPGIMNSAAYALEATALKCPGSRAPCAALSGRHCW